MVGKAKRGLCENEAVYDGVYKHEYIDKYIGARACREEFAYLVPKTRPVIEFCVNKNEKAYIANAFAYIEKKLHLRHKTKFYHVKHHPEILRIETPGFWRSTALRRSLFTLLIRAGRHYKGRLKDLQNEYHLHGKIVWKAFLGFLSGKVTEVYRGQEGCSVMEIREWAGETGWRSAIEEQIVMFSKPKKKQTRYFK